MDTFSCLSFFSVSVPLAGAGRSECRAVFLLAVGVVQVHPAAQLVGFLDQHDGGLGQDGLAVRSLVALDAEGVQLRDDDPGNGLDEGGRRSAGR